MLNSSREDMLFFLCYCPMCHSQTRKGTQAYKSLQTFILEKEIQTTLYDTDCLILFVGKNEISGNSFYFIFEFFHEAFTQLKVIFIDCEKTVQAFTDGANCTPSFEVMETTLYPTN